MIERLRLSAIGLAAALGVGLTAFGLWQLDWPADLPSQDEAFWRLSCLLAGGLLAVLVLHAWLRLAMWAAGSAVAATIAICTGNGLAFMVALWVFASSVIVGRAAFKLLRVAPGPCNYWPFWLLAGAGLCGTAIELTARFRIHYVAVYAMALLLPLIAGSAWVRELARALWAARRQPRTQAPAPTWLAAGIASVALVHFGVALLPEQGHDALAMHFVIAHLLALRHLWGFDVTTYVWAVMPMIGDWIFALAYMLGNEAAPRLVNVGFVFMMAWLVRDLVRWAGGNETGGRWGALLFLSTPLVFTESSSLFIDSVWASFVLGGVLALLVACSAGPGKGRSMLQAGMLLGLAMASKVITVTILVPLLVLLAVRHRSWLARQTARHVGAGLALFLALGCVPYVVAFRHTRNPVFPFFNQVFKSPLFLSTENFESASVFGRGLRWDLPYQMTFSAGKMMEAGAGVGGFQWLLVLLPVTLAVILLWDRRALALLFVALGSVVVAFQSVSYLRYVFPAFAMMSAVAGVGLSGGLAQQEGIRKRLAQALGVAAFCAFALNLLFLGAGSPYRDFSVYALLDSASRDEWLEQHAPARLAIALVNELNTARAPVAYLAPSGTTLIAGLDADVLVPTWYNAGFLALMRGQKSLTAMAGTLHRLNIEYIVLDERWAERPQRAMVEGLTEVIARYGPTTVRRFKPQFRYQDELIKSPHFEAPEAWTIAAGAGPVAHGMAVRLGAAVFQGVPVVPGRHYLNSITVSCAQQGLVRMQINWSDPLDVLVRSDIRIVECEPEATAYSMEVISPPGAIQAVVYASSHTASEAVFTENSFKR